MSLETVSDQNAIKVPSSTLPFPNVWWGRVLFGLFITVIPAFSFWAIQLLKPEWQTGELSAYITLLLFPEASLLFFPLMAYSIICYLLLLIAPARYSPLFFIRFGIYTGVLLALQYSIALIFYFLNNSIIPAFILLWISPLVITRLYHWAAGKWNIRTVNIVLAILIVGAYLIGSVMERRLFSLLFFILVILVMAAPFWSFLLALRATIWLVRNYETKVTLSHGFGLFAWLTVYLAAWRFDILKMYELYMALPPTPPPDCYIASAAARGHPRFVGSRIVRRGNANSMIVNEQLQILKCAELALLATNPRAHKLLRKIYDAAGKQLARNLQNPFLADVAYLVLKPCEWMTGFILKIIVPEIVPISKEIYTN